MDDRPSSLLIGNWVAVAADATTDPERWPSETLKCGVRVGLIVDLFEMYVAVIVCRLYLRLVTD